MAKPGKITPREREGLPGCMLPLSDRHLGRGINSQAFDSVKGGRYGRFQRPQSEPPAPC